MVASEWVMNTVGIEVGALDSDNMRSFKRVTVGTGCSCYGEVAVWFHMLSKISNCKGLVHVVRAKEYAYRPVVE